MSLARPLYRVALRVLQRVPLSKAADLSAFVFARSVDSATLRRRPKIGGAYRRSLWRKMVPPWLGSPRKTPGACVSNLGEGVLNLSGKMLPRLNDRKSVV